MWADFPLRYPVGREFIMGTNAVGLGEKGVRGSYLRAC